MEALKEGDLESMREIISRWERPLVSFIYRYTQDLPASVDLAQDTFVKIFQKRDRFDPHFRFTTWMFAIALNLCRKHARWKGRHPEWSRTVSLYADADDEKEGIPLCERIADPSNPSASEPDDRLPALRSAIAALSHDLRSTLILHHYEGLSYSEIAEILGCSARGVETRLYRARNQIRKRMGIITASGDAKAAPEGLLGAVL